MRRAGPELEFFSSEKLVQYKMLPDCLLSLPERKELRERNHLPVSDEGRI